ncbi:MAG: thiamine pyrophosphate-dependent enzyme [bacterium]
MSAAEGKQAAKKFKAKVATRSDGKLVGLSKEELLQVYRTMLFARRLDNKMLTLLKQGKSYFHIGGSGHEAIQVAAAKILTPKKDWAYPYYRDLAFCLQYGMTPEEVLLCFLARADDPNSGGRQMPCHYGHQELRIVSQSSPTGTQYLQAVGCAMGCKKDGTDEVVYVSSGEGSTSQGDFHEALNWASRDKLPVIFVMQDNKYAISVPIHQQTAEGIYYLARGYKGLDRYKVDGTDFIESYKIMKEAVERTRSGEGPSIVVADVIRLLPHSSSDDHTKYRTKEDLESDVLRDPIKRLSKFLISNKIIHQKELETLSEEVKKLVNDAADFAESCPMAKPETATLHLYSSDRSPIEGSQAFKFENDEINGEPIVIVDALNHALSEEIERNDKILMFGQDIQDDKGGVFTVTKGLTRKFGADKVFNAPLAESSIVGVAIGLATRGFKPVVEIQFGDYIWTAMMQIRNELATMRYRSNGQWKCPLVIRVPVGGYIHGGLCHSQNIEGFFAHFPGILLALPSNAADAKGLLKSAIRGDDPAIFMEHKALYRQAFAKTPEPSAEYLIPFGKAAIKKEGNDITVVTYGMMVHRSLEAVKQLEEKHGITGEVIDIRTMNPLDKKTILNSVKKTNKVLVVYEDTLTSGFGAEIAAIIANEAFEYLDAPVKRIAAKDAHVPYSWSLEPAILPQTADIVKGLEELAEY